MSKFDPLFLTKEFAEKPVLVLLSGLPRCGKSTYIKFALEAQQGIAVVSPDAIRRALYSERYRKDGEAMVWTIAKYMVKALFLAGHHLVYLDATNGTRASRAAWASKSWETKAVVFCVGGQVCKLRAIETNQQDLFEVIDTMERNWEPIEGDLEGITEIIYCDSNGSVIDEWKTS